MLHLDFPILKLLFGRCSSAVWPGPQLWLAAVLRRLLLCSPAGTLCLLWTQADDCRSIAPRSPSEAPQFSFVRRSLAPRSPSWAPECLFAQTPSDYIFFFLEKEGPTVLAHQHRPLSTPS